MKLFGAGLFALLLSSTTGLATCPHESLSAKLYENSEIEIYRDLQATQLNIDEDTIASLIKTHTQLKSYFPTALYTKVSLVLITAESFTEGYPNLTLHRWGYFNSLINRTCGKKIIFLRIGNSTTLPPSFFYNFTHELFHLYRYEIDPDNFGKNLWAEEGMADHIAFKLTKISPSRFYSNFLNTEVPISFLPERQHFADNNAYYGQSFLFFDFLEQRLLDNYSMQNIYNLTNPSLEHLSKFYNTTESPSNNASPRNTFLNFKRHYPDITDSENFYIEYVIKLMIPEFNAFHDSSVIKKPISPPQGTLPKNYSYAYIPIYNYRKAGFAPTLDAAGTKSFVLFFRKTGRPFSVFTLEDFLKYLSIEDNKNNIEKANLILFNLSDEDINYSFRE